MSKEKLVCFDVDGTLVDGVSWLLLTKGLGCSTDKHMAIFNRARNREISFIQGERLLTKMYRDSKNATESFIRKLFRKVKLRPGAKKAVEYLKSRNYSVFLISGAIDIYVEEVAKKIGVDGFYANSSLEFDNNGLLSKIHYRDNQGGVKVEQLRELADSNNTNTKGIVFIGDSENDIEAFVETGRGIAIHNENDELKNVAWKVIENLEDIRTVI